MFLSRVVTVNGVVVCIVPWSWKNNISCHCKHIQYFAMMQIVAQEDRKHPVKVLCGVFLGNRLHK